MARSVSRKLETGKISFLWGLRRGGGLVILWLDYHAFLLTSWSYLGSGHPLFCIPRPDSLCCLRNAYVPHSSFLSLTSSAYEVSVRVPIPLCVVIQWFSLTNLSHVRSPEEPGGQRELLLQVPLWWERRLDPACSELLLQLRPPGEGSPLPDQQLSISAHRPWCKGKCVPVFLSSRFRWVGDNSCETS